MSSTKDIIRDGNNNIIGRYDGKTLRDNSGKIVSRYDEKYDITRDSSGKIISRTGDQRIRELHQ